MAEKTVYISFGAAINKRSVEQLMKAVNRQLAKQASSKFVMWFIPVKRKGYPSADDIDAAISGYYLLEAVPAELQGHTFGELPFIYLPLYCAARRRTTSFVGSFVLDGPRVLLRAEYTLAELQALEKRLVRANESVQRILAATTGKTEKQLQRIVETHLALPAKEAKKLGLVHAITSKRFQRGSGMISIR